MALFKDMIVLVWVTHGKSAIAVKTCLKDAKPLHHSGSILKLVHFGPVWTEFGKKVFYSAYLQEYKLLFNTTCLYFTLWLDVLLHCKINYTK